MGKLGTIFGTTCALALAYVLYTHMYENKRVTDTDSDLLSDSVVSDEDIAPEVVEDTRPRQRWAVLLGIHNYSSENLKSALVDAIKHVIGRVIDVEVTLVTDLSEGSNAYWCACAVDLFIDPDAEDGEFVLRSTNPYLPKDIRVISVLPSNQNFDPSFSCEELAFEVLLPCPLLDPLTDDDDEQPNPSLPFEAAGEDIYPSLARRFLGLLLGRRLNPALLNDPAHPPQPLTPAPLVTHASLDKVVASPPPLDQVLWRLIVRGDHRLTDLWARLVAGMAVAVSLRLIQPGAAADALCLPANSPAVSPSTPSPVWIGRLPCLPPCSVVLSAARIPDEDIVSSSALNDASALASPRGGAGGAGCFLAPPGALDVLFRWRGDLYKSAWASAYLPVAQWTHRLLTRQYIDPADGEVKVAPRPRIDKAALQWGSTPYSAHHHTSSSPMATPRATRGPSAITGGFPDSPPARRPAPSSVPRLHLAGLHDHAASSFTGGSMKPSAASPRAVPYVGSAPPMRTPLDDLLALLVPQHADSKYAATHPHALNAAGDATTRHAATQPLNFAGAAGDISPRRQSPRAAGVNRMLIGGDENLMQNEYADEDATAGDFDGLLLGAPAESFETPKKKKPSADFEDEDEDEGGSSPDSFWSSSDSSLNGDAPARLTEYVSLLSPDQRKRNDQDGKPNDKDVAGGASPNVGQKTREGRREYLRERLTDFGASPQHNKGKGWGAKGGNDLFFAYLDRMGWLPELLLDGSSEQRD